MEEDTLQIFRRQIGAWIESLLARGRYPFRRIDLTQPLLTKAGELSPDLILWINRDSFMAGGLLLVTGRNEADDIERGRYCAEALGLQHFLTWSATEVVFWEICGDSISRHRALTTPPPGSEPAAFRDLLVSILDELKYLAVAGSTAPAQLPPQYLANLCRITLADVQ
ncbi:MAG TPA: hypothetical protein VKA48_04980, partial [Gammaproteobacteria bacterium]|nr:hypothetical protein [Gammaproteobacteria bacterium]